MGRRANRVNGDTPATRRLRRRGLTTLALTLATAATLCSSAQAAGKAVGVWPTIPAGAASLGALSRSAQIDATIALTPRDPTGLAAYAQAVSTPGSPDYHQYLSVAQFAQRFGAAPSEIAGVRTSLAAPGLTTGSVSANGLSLEISGSAAQLGSAFSTSFSRYRLSSGRTAFANTSAPIVGANLTGRVQGVFGLDTLPRLHPEGLVRAPRASKATASTASADIPCAAATEEANKHGAFTADQIASAYGYPNLYGEGDVGAGATVALYELEPFAATDIASYQSCYGTSASVTTTTVDSGAGTGPGSGEAALDIEDVIGAAPQASVHAYEGPNTNQGAFDTYQTIISNDTEKVISTSWGLCEAGEGSAAAAAENTLFEEAATQGQSIFAAAGDSGAADCGRKGAGATVDDPASQPFVTGVGGTSLSLSPRTEVVWNDGSTRGATAGGVSKLWQQPSYQQGQVLSQSAITCGTGMTACREVPDVSADADENTGYVVFWSGSWTAFGGTSAAAPTWASLAALGNASSTCAGTSVGFINPALYRAAANGLDQNFNDITSGNNTYQDVTGYTAQVGYDMASGLGTPIAQALVPALCTDVVTVTSPGPQSSTVGVGVSLTVTAHSSAQKALTYSATGLPAGLAIDPSTGVISGTPTTLGSSIVTVTATDAGGSACAATVSWTVANPPPPPPQVAIATLAAQFGQVGAAVQLAVQATDSEGFALTYTASGLPAGLAINPSSGVISGTPRQTGTATVHLTVSDGHGGSAAANFSWAIAPRPRVTGARLKLSRAGKATLLVSVSTGSPRIAITQVRISDPPGQLRFSFRRHGLANAADASARSAQAAHVNTSLPRGGGSLTFSYRAARRGAATLVVPLTLKGAPRRGAHVRVMVVTVDAAGVRAASSLRLAL